MTRPMTYADREQANARKRERLAADEALRASVQAVYDRGQWIGLVYGFAYGAIIGIVLTVLLCGVAGC